MTILSVDIFPQGEHYFWQIVIDGGGFCGVVESEEAAKAATETIISWLEVREEINELEETLFTKTKNTK